MDQSLVCSLWRHSAPIATKEKRPLTMNCFFDLGCVPRATICGNACLPWVAGARARREGRSFNVVLVGAALRVACGSFPAAYGVSRRFPRPLARGQSHAASSGRFVRFYSRPRWSRPINGLPSSFPDFCRKYDLTSADQQHIGSPPAAAFIRRAAPPILHDRKLNRVTNRGS